MRLLLIFSFILFNYTLLAFNTVIKGKADRIYIGKQVYFYEISDALSGYKNLLDQTTVGNDGSFEVKGGIQSTCQAVISIDRVNGSIFLVPGSDYNITFPALPTGVARTMNNTNTVNIIFNGIGPNDINGIIGEFNLAFDEFVDENAGIVFDHGFRAKLDQFRQSADSLYIPLNNDFINTYVNFTFADLEFNIGTSKKLIFQKYLAGKTPAIKNPSFGSFITLFFDKEIERFDNFTKDKPLATAIKNNSPATFTETLKRNDFLDNAAIREIVAVFALNQAYNLGVGYKTNIPGMIRQIGELSTDTQVRLLAGNYYKALTDLAAGSPAYDFKLKDSKGKIVSITGFSGKPTLITFWASWSKDALAELSLLNDLQLKYGKNINFLNISIDDNIEEYEKFLSSHYNLRGTFLNYRNDKYIIETYNVMSIPQFVLLDAKGNYLRAVAPAPSQGLENLLKDLPAR